MSNNVGHERAAQRICRYCGESELRIRTTQPTAEGDQTAWMECKVCHRRWRLDERLGYLVKHCAWGWAWAGYGRQKLRLELDGWPVDVDSRYLCIRLLDDQWGRGWDAGVVDRNGHGWGSGKETGWYILGADYQLFDKAEPRGNGPLDQLIADLFNERLEQLRENDRRLEPIKPRRRRRPRD